MTLKGNNLEEEFFFSGDEQWNDGRMEFVIRDLSALAPEVVMEAIRKQR